MQANPSTEYSYKTQTVTLWSIAHRMESHSQQPAKRRPIPTSLTTEPHAIAVKRPAMNAINISYWSDRVWPIIVVLLDSKQQPHIRQTLIHQKYYIVQAHCRHGQWPPTTGRLQFLKMLHLATSSLTLKISAFTIVYTVSQKKACDYIFCNNWNNECTIIIIFGTLINETICHRMVVSFPISSI